MFGSSNRRSRFCSRRVAAATATALAFTFAGVAFAQPFGGPGGPMGHGAGGGPEQMIGHLIAKAKANLGLNTSQQTMFDAAVAQARTAHDQGRALMQKVKDTMAAELAKAEPDLAAVAAVADDARAQGQTLRKQVRDQWLQLYATFSPDQKAVVRDMLQKRMARMDSFRQKMREHWHGGAAG